MKKRNYSTREEAYGDWVKATWPPYDERKNWWRSLSTEARQEFLKLVDAKRIEFGMLEPTWVGEPITDPQARAFAITGLDQKDLPPGAQKDWTINPYNNSGELSLLNFSHPHWRDYYMNSEEGVHKLLVGLGAIIAAPFVLLSAIYSGWFTAVLGLICIAVGGGAAYGAALFLTWLCWLPAAQTSGFYETLPYAEVLVLFVSLPLAWKVGIIGTIWYFNKNPIK